MMHPARVELHLTIPPIAPFDATLECIGRDAAHYAEPIITALEGPPPLRVRLRPPPFLLPSLLHDLSRALNLPGQSLEAFSRALGPRTLILEHSERLAPRSGHDLIALHNEESSAVRRWVGGLRSALLLGDRSLEQLNGLRVTRQLPDLAGGRLLNDVGQVLWGEADVEQPWTTPSSLGLLRALFWWRGEQGLEAARAEVQHTRSLHRLVDDLRDELGHAHRLILGLVKLLGEVEAALLTEALSSMEAPAALEELLQSGLLLQHDARVAAAPWVDDLRLLEGLGGTSPHHLQRAATAFMAQVGSADTPTPEEAQRIFQAHQLYIAAGDIDNALSTAQHRSAGLVELARQLSFEERYQDAFALYRHLRTPDWMRPELVEQTPRLMSYIHHYYAFNGERAAQLSPDETALAYREALALWPENALWHGRLIGLLFRDHRPEEAWSLLEEAEVQVPEHDQRTVKLRVQPAEELLGSGQLAEALRLLEPVWTDPQPQQARARLRLQVLEEGFEVQRLDAAPVHLLLNRPATVKLLYLSDGAWKLVFPAARLEQLAPSPLQAWQQLVETLAAETLRLVKTPTHRLPREAIARKGELIGLFDLLNSDLGLSFRTHRWLVGRLTPDASFQELGDGHGPLQLSAELSAQAHEDAEALYFARVPVARDGAPCGPVEALERVGSGRSTAALLSELQRLSDPATP